MTEHATLPWETFGAGIKTVEGTLGMDESQLWPVIQVGRGACSGANAEFIVRACNSHDAMLEALKSLTTPRYGGDVCHWCGSGEFGTPFEHHGPSCPLLPALDLIAAAEKEA